MRCRSAGRWGAVTALCAAALTGLALPSSAEPYSGSYTASASAALLGVDFTVHPGVLFDQLVDGGASVAQAQVDSLGSTSAFASDPFPSSSVVGLPGLAASFGFSGLPAYPLIASSNASSPSDHKSAGPINLDASSALGSSSGTVSDGATRALATTTFNASTQAVTAVADSQITSLAAGDTLAFSGVHTSAKMTVDAGGKTVQSASFTIASLTILGIRATIDGSGLSIAKNTIPLGIDPSTILAPLLTALADRGVTISFLPEVRTSTSITSAGLRITGLFPVPAGLVPSINLPIPLPVGVGVSGLNDASTAVTIGRASASVSNSSYAAAPTAGTGTTSVGDYLVGGVTQPGVSPPSSGITGQATPPVEQRPAVGPGQLAPTAAVLDAVRLGRIYPVLALAGVIGLICLQLIRRRGVRTP